MCVAGKCLDCSTGPQLACASGQICNERQCIKDTCAGVSCASDQYCSNGTCVSLTCGLCGANQKCVAGQCVAFKCDSASCPSDKYCDYVSGTCLPNMCAAKTCPNCAPATGECLSHPCANVRCPDCYACDLTPDGVAFCQAKPNCAQTVALESGNTGGGCNCEVGAGRSSPASFVWLGVGVLALLFTRRTRR